MDITLKKPQPFRVMSEASRNTLHSPSLTIDERLLLSIFGSLTVYIIAAFYTITLRGIFGNALTSFTDVTTINTVSNVATLDHIANVIHASRLAACGFWTSMMPWGPLQHLICLTVGPLYTWKEFTYFLFDSRRSQIYSIDTSNMILNMVALLTCKGIPQHSAASFLSILSCAYASYSSRTSQLKRKMII